MISPETRVQICRYFYAEHWKIGTIAQALDVQGLCNRADFPMLGVEIAANLYAGFGADHASSPSSWNLWERIDEAAWPATDRAAQPEVGSLFQPAGQLRWQRERNRHRDRF